MKLLSGEMWIGRAPRGVRKGEAFADGPVVIVLEASGRGRVVRWCADGNGATRHAATLNRKRNRLPRSKRR